MATRNLAQNGPFCSRDIHVEAKYQLLKFQHNYEERNQIAFGFENCTAP